MRYLLSVVVALLGVALVTSYRATGRGQPKAECPANSHWSQCDGMCRPTCADPRPMCPRICVPGCACDWGHVWFGERCIPLHQCRYMPGGGQGGAPGKRRAPVPAKKMYSTSGEGFSCEGKEDGNYADPEDCSKYYTCSNGIATSMPCPPDLYYNEKTDRCDYLQNVNCDRIPRRCLAPKKVGPCRAAIPRVFFNKETGQCEDFRWGGCSPNPNNFETMEECQNTCETCPKHTHWNPCKGDCVATCDNPKPACPRICGKPGCSCKPGFLWHQGKCIPALECALPIKRGGTSVKGKRREQGRRPVPTKKASSSSEEGYRRVCYYTSWAQYRHDPYAFTPEDLDPSLCTHFIFAFAMLADNHLVTYEWNDEDMYQALIDQVKPAKTLLAVGGWNMGMENVTTMLETEENRAEFITTSIEFLRRYEFDGLDLDFEYPGDTARGGRAEDKEKFTLLVQEMRLAFEEEATGDSRLLLTAAVGAGVDTVTNGYEIEEISRELDFLNLMAYDFYGAWGDSPVTGFNAPLYPASENDKLNVESAVDMWIDGGANPSKINLGIPTYGRTFTLADSHDHGVGSPAIGPGSAGCYTREAGFRSYYEICNMLKELGATRVYDSVQQVPYAYFGNQWVGYDDKESIAAKIDFLKSRGLGGAMVWAPDLDDFVVESEEWIENSCDEDPYPLLTEIYSMLEMEGKHFGDSAASHKKMSAARPKPRSHAPIRQSIPAKASSSSGDGFSCEGMEDGNYPDPEDCSKFYTCSNGKPTHMSCPADLYYNEKTDQCDYLQNVNCDRIPRRCLAPNKVGDFECSGYFPRVFFNRETGQCEDFIWGGCPPSLNNFETMEECENTCETCPKHTVWNPCKGDCVATCDNPKPACPRICGKPGCSCKPGFLWHQGKCILALKCPKLKGTPVKGKRSSSVKKVTLSTVDAFSCDGLEDGDYTDPKDCSKYYACSNGIPTHMSCPPDLYFNEETDQCDYPENVDCGDRFSCEGLEDGDYADPEDCTMYYSCTNGESNHMPCPEGLYFNEKTDQCDYPENVPECAHLARQTPRKTSPSSAARPKPRSHTPIRQSIPVKASSSSESCGLSTFAYITQSDCSGHDLDSPSGPIAPEICLDSCCDNPACLSFQYNTRHECFLKSKLCSVEEKVYSSTGNMYDRIGPAADFCKGKPDGNYADPEDCSKYYECSNGLTYLMSCQEGLYYKEETDQCEDPELVNCGCPKGYQQHSHNCYKAYNDEKTFDGAAAACQGDGGSLAIPLDPATHKFLIYLKNQVDRNTGFWLGFDDLDREGDWRYINEMSLRVGTFQPWYPGEPNNLNNDEDCGMMFQEAKHNQWNDSKCSKKFKFICQIYLRAPIAKQTSHAQIHRHLPAKKGLPSSAVRGKGQVQQQIRHPQR
ncbi:uncharacterized protein LOC144867557 [Branchiostoma floridae x Branchiostoma japonicum]